MGKINFKTSRATFFFPQAILGSKKRYYRKFIFTGYHLKEELWETWLIPGNKTDTSGLYQQRKTKLKSPYLEQLQMVIWSCTRYCRHTAYWTWKWQDLYFLLCLLCTQQPWQRKMRVPQLWWPLMLTKWILLSGLVCQRWQTCNEIIVYLIWYQMLAGNMN